MKNKEWQLTKTNHKSNLPDQHNINTSNILKIQEVNLDN